jgi:hypothetical protein
MEIKTAKDLLKLTPYSSDAYDSYALTSLTACSIFLLKIWELLPSYENIAIVNYRLFPIKFAMVGWQEFPDMNRTNRSILQMRPKYRNLATSITDKGVFLNERGVLEAKSILSKLGSPKIGDNVALEIDSTFKAEPKGKRARSVHPEDFIQKLRGSMLYKYYSASKWAEAETIDLIGFLGVYDHTPSTEKRRRLKDFKLHARELNDVDALNFLDAVEQKFDTYLSR